MDSSENGVWTWKVLGVLQNLLDKTAVWAGTTSVPCRFWVQSATAISFVTRRLMTVAPITGDTAMDMAVRRQPGGQPRCRHHEPLENFWVSLCVLTHCLPCDVLHIVRKSVLCASSGIVNIDFMHCLVFYIFVLCMHRLKVLFKKAKFQFPCH